MTAVTTEDYIPPTFATFLTDDNCHEVVYIYIYNKGILTAVICQKWQLCRSIQNELKLKPNLTELNLGLRRVRSGYPYQ